MLRHEQEGDNSGPRTEYRSGDSLDRIFGDVSSQDLTFEQRKELLQLTDQQRVAREAAEAKRREEEREYNRIQAERELSERKQHTENRISQIKAVGPYVCGCLGLIAACFLFYLKEPSTGGILVGGSLTLMGAKGMESKK